MVRVCVACGSVVSKVNEFLKELNIPIVNIKSIIKKKFREKKFTFEFVLCDQASDELHCCIQ